MDLCLVDCLYLISDYFLVIMNDGTRQTGVFVMLLIGNVCMLFSGSKKKQN